jgi:hypothetical protein
MKLMRWLAWVLVLIEVHPAAAEEDVAVMKLLELVPVELRCPQETLPAEKNAFPLFLEAGKLYKEQDLECDDCDEVLAFDDLYSENLR